MENLTMRNLENLFEGAKKENAKYIGLKIMLPHAEKPEIIINSAGNFDAKLEYYKNTYTDDLKHKNDSKVEIIGFTYGNTFTDIEKDLM